MPIVSVSEDKVGPTCVVNIDMMLEDDPLFPGICPCCAELVDDCAFILATCDELPPVPFPACEICARHSAVEGQVSKIMVPVLLVLTVATVLGILAYRGAEKIAFTGASSSWQFWAGLSALEFPVISPFNAMVIFLGAMIVLMGYFFLYWLLMAPIHYLLGKSSCKWHKQAARTSRWFSVDAGGYCRRFIFENPTYAEHFKNANASDSTHSEHSP